MHRRQGEAPRYLTLPGGRGGFPGTGVDRRGSSWSVGVFFS